MLDRTVNSEKRLFEILDSMPIPIVTFKVINDWVPSIKVKALNHNGICLYHYTHSGYIGLDTLVNKLNTYPTENYDSLAI